MSSTGTTAALRVTVTDRLGDEERADWLRFWQSSPHTHPRQHLDVAQAEGNLGRRLLYGRAHADGEIVGIGVLALRPLLPAISTEAVCIRGPAFDDLDVGRELVREIVRAAASAGAVRVRLAPHWLYPEADRVEAMLAEAGFAPEGGAARDDTGRIDLAREDDAIFAGFTTSTRKEVRLAARRGVVVRALATPDEIESAWRMVAARRRLLRLSPVPRREFLELAATVGREEELGVVLGALHEDRLLGTLAMLRSTRLAHPVLYAVDPEAARALSNANVGAALWWEAIRWAKSSGCAELDVEGNVRPLDPSHPRYEYENFKRRFAPEPRERLAEHVLVCRPALWTVHRLSARAAGSWRTVLARVSRLAAGSRRGTSRARPLAGLEA